MINRLHIRNYAIIEELDIRFAEGLTIITGETGAGKSILLGALGLIMGNRADTKTLYDESEKCIVEGYFDIREYDLKDFFQDNDIDYEEELVLRRELTPSGKSRAFINDTPVNLKAMQDLCAELVDLHQQFDTQDIHEVSFQLKMIDALAGNKDILAHYRTQYREYQNARRRLEQLLALSEQSARETSFAQFQLEELSKAELGVGEQESLEEELRSLTHAEDIKRTVSQAYQALSESELSVMGQLQSISHALGQVSRYDAKAGQLTERFNGLMVELQDLSHDLDRLAEQTEYNPERLQAIQERLDLIYRLEKKHGVVAVEDLLRIREELEGQLQGYGNLDAEITGLRQTIETLEGHLIQMAQLLSERRKSVVEDFERKVMSMLAQLAMEHAQLKVDFHIASELGPTGWDEVNFLFAANRGSRMQSIKDVASGGELSRLALVTKSLVARAIPLPTLIFDEIDAGISGDVALKMGNILRHLSNEHQVVTITHSPQVASKADRHYFVYKEDTAERSITKVRLLDVEDQVQVIATMLSQSPPTASAIQNARELLGMG